MPPTKRRRVDGAADSADGEVPSEAQSKQSVSSVHAAEAVAAFKMASQRAGGADGSLLAASAKALARQVETDPAAFVEVFADVPEDYLEPVFKRLSFLALQAFADSGKFSGVLDSTVLRGSMQETEDRFRSLFAQERDHADIQDPHVMLMRPHEFPEAFAYNAGDAKEQAIPLLFRQVSKHADRPIGQPAICPKADFQRNWNAFSLGQLKTLDWSNVFVAGGSIQACLRPYSDDFVKKAGSPPTVAAVRELFNGNGTYYPAGHSGWRDNNAKPEQQTILSSDIDMFIYGLNGEAATAKLQQIEDAIIENNPMEMVVVRTPQSVSFVTQYPYRHIQVILRCYKSPAEILMGFDLDSVTVGFDGQDVWALPRFHRAVTRGYNLVAQSRRSKTYESRLMKYALRGFAVAVPDLDLSRVDVEGIAAQELKSLDGGARLVWLESKLQNKPKEDPKASAWQQQHDPVKDWWRYLTKAEKKQIPRKGWHMQKPDWVDISNQGESIVGRFSVQSNWLKPRVADYEAEAGHGAADYSAVFLPWGPRWNAGRLSTWLSEKSLSGMYGSDDESSVRKAFQYGSNVASVVGKSDALEYMDEDEDEDDDDEDEEGGNKKPKSKPSADLPPHETDVILKDVLHELRWLVDEPGRQSIGSFHPEDGDWYASLYAAYDASAAAVAAVAASDAAGKKAAKKGSDDDEGDDDDGDDVEDGSGDDDDDEDGGDDGDDRPKCAFGANCYRQNPQHHAEMKHPAGHDPSKVAH